MKASNRSGEVNDKTSGGTVMNFTQDAFSTGTQQDVLLAGYFTKYAFDEIGSISNSYPVPRTVFLPFSSFFKNQKRPSLISFVELKQA